MTAAPAYSNIRVEIQKIDYLPPMPSIAQEILIASVDHSSDIEDIAAIIKKDAGLTAKIIGVANSAYFSYPRQVTTLEEAIINILGLDLVKGFALTIAMSGVFDPEKCQNFDLNRYWCSAFLTAELASGFSSRITSKQSIKAEQFYLYGLLHNIGILVLADRFPNIMSELFSAAQRDKEKHLIEYEKETIDFNHHQAGGWLARKWNLPEEIIDVIEHLHERNYQGNHDYPVILIGLCSRIARKWLLETEYCPIKEVSGLKSFNLDTETIENYLAQTRTKLDDIQQLVKDMTC